MMTRTIPQNLALAILLVLTANATSACDLGDGRSKVPTAPALELSSPTLSQNYSWQVSLTGNGGACEFDWTWLLADGTTVTGGSTTCATPVSGTGSIPSGATGVTVNGSLIDSTPICNSDNKSVTKSFDGSGNVSITINLSVSGSFKAPQFFGNANHLKCGSANATFSLTTS